MDKGTLRIILLVVILGIMSIPCIFIDHFLKIRPEAWGVIAACIGFAVAFPASKYLADKLPFGK